MGRPATKRDLNDGLRRVGRRLTWFFALYMVAFVVIVGSLWIAKHGN